MTTNWEYTCTATPHYYTLGVQVYCLWPPHSYELGVHVYCLWPLLFMCPRIVLVCIVYTTPITLVNCTSQLPVRVSYNSVSVYYFYYYILKLNLPPPGGEESPWTTASHWMNKFFFTTLLSYVCGHPTTTHWEYTIPVLYPASVYYLRSATGIVCTLHI